MRRDDHSSRGVLPREVCLWVIPKPRKRGDPEPQGRQAIKMCTKFSINVAVMIVTNHQPNFCQFFKTKKPLAEAIFNYL